MRQIITICRWEINKIIGNWQKAAAIFLIPAAIMVFAINIFPQLVSYLSTGTFGNQRVIVVNSPDSFKEYEEKHEEKFTYVYEDWDLDTILDEDYIFDRTKSGDLVLMFVYDGGYDDYLNFEEEVSNYYNHLLSGDSDYTSDAYALIAYSSNSIVTMTRATSLEEDVVKNYASDLLYTLGEDYAALFNSDVYADDYNPITYVLNHRTDANSMAARVVPGILALLMYYCVYSLTCDMLAQEKTRGFLSKLKMTPVPSKYILGGKILSITLLVSMSGVVTFLFLFISSWLNRSNDAMSLLPFGMLLTPAQLVYLLLAIPSGAFIMAVFCFHVTLSLNKLADIIANLQIPLMLLLVEFFIQLVTPSTVSPVELVIPIHNLVALIKTIYMSETDITSFLLVITINVLFGIYGLRCCTRKFEEEILS